MSLYDDSMITKRNIVFKTGKLGITHVLMRSVITKHKHPNFDVTCSII